MITNLLPWIAVALAIIALATRDGKLGRSPSKEGLESVSSFALSLLMLAGLVALLWVAGMSFGASLGGFKAAAAGFTVGAGGAALCAILSGMKRLGEARVLGPLAVGTVCVGMAGFLKGMGLEPAQIGVGFGLAVGAWVLSRSSNDNDWASSAAAFGNALIALEILGRRGPGGHSMHAGLVVGMAVVAAGLVTSLTRSAAKKDQEPFAGWGGLLFALLLVGAGLLAGKYYVWLGRFWQVFGGAVLIAVMVHWLNPKERGRSAAGFAISCVIWVAAATLAFAFLKGFGMAVALAGGVGTLLVLGNRLALLSLGPMAALVAYRSFHAIQPDTASAFDIGQHYALIGLLSGLSLMLLVWEFRRALPERQFSGLGRAIAALLFAALPVAVAILLAGKGYVGLLIGLGVGAALIGIQGAGSAWALAVPMGVGLAMSTLYGWSEPLLQYTRDEKIKALLWLGPGIAVIAAVLAFFCIGGRKEEEGVSA